VVLCRFKADPPFLLCLSLSPSSRTHARTPPTRYNRIEQQVTFPIRADPACLRWNVARRPLVPSLPNTNCFPTTMSPSALLTSSRPPPSAVLAQVTSGFSLSFPVKDKLAEHLHKRNEGPVSAYDEDIIRLRYNEQMPFLEFLNVPHDRLPVKKHLKERSPRTKQCRTCITSY
jgi:hypothetical protein